MPDLVAARRSLEAFTEMVGEPLARWQAAALALAVRVTVIVAPRQSGKSRSLALLALWWAYRGGGQRVLIVSAGEEASRRLLAEVRRIAAGSPLLRGSVVDETAGLVTLSNGSEIRSVPASERQVRGWSVDLLLVDEAALVPDDLLLGAALPTTAARPDARVVLASSAVTAAGAFYDHAVRGEQGARHVQTFRWVLTDASWIAPSVIEAARESMTEARFAAEYEGVFASGADALISKWTLDRATADIAVSGWEALRGPARVLGGVDWGQTTDRSAIVAVARLAVPGERLFAVVAAHAWKAGAPLVGPGGVVEEIAGAGAHFDTLTAETNGLGGPCAAELERLVRERPATRGGGTAGGIAGPPIWSGESWEKWERERQRLIAAGVFVTAFRPVHTSSEMKAATYSALRLLLDRGLLIVPAGLEALRRELLLLRVDLTATGLERIEASSGHDDLADALMLAAGPYRDRDGRWRSRLADLGDPATRLPTVPVPELPEVVATGAGRWLPRAPALASVDGPHVTPQVPPPVPAAARPPEPVRYGRFLIHRNQRRTS